MIQISLPLPPTINHYYGHRGSQKFIKKAGIEFRKLVAEIVSMQEIKTLEGRLAVFVSVYPADSRRQDIDNRLKSLLDALTHAGVWLDDSQIDDLHIVRREIVKGGRVRVVIAEA